jgi:hypothetical protein
MPSAPNTRRREVSWTTSGSPEQVLAGVESLANDERRGQVLSRSDSQIELSVGSRAAYRMWGFLTPARLIPVRIMVTVLSTDSGATSVTADMVSDPGWEAFEISKWVTRSYDKAFDYLVGLLALRSP